MQLLGLGISQRQLLAAKSSRAYLAIGASLFDAKTGELIARTRVHRALPRFDRQWVDEATPANVKLAAEESKPLILDSLEGLLTGSLVQLNVFGGGSDYSELRQFFAPRPFW